MTGCPPLPHPAVEAYCLRLILAAADEDQWLFNTCLAEVLDAGPEYTNVLIQSLVMTCVVTFGRIEENWQAHSAARLAELLNQLDGQGHGAHGAALN